jgi:hypothetical protein
MQGYTLCFKNMGLNSATSFCTDGYSVIELLSYVRMSP